MTTDSDLKLLLYFGSQHLLFSFERILGTSNQNPTHVPPGLVWKLSNLLQCNPHHQSEEYNFRA